MGGTLPETRLQGVSLCPGVALGRVCLYLHEVTDTKVVTSEGPAYEEYRLNESLTWMVRRLEELAREAEAKLGPEEAEIFRVHRMILEDESLQQRLFDAIQSEGISAEEAIERQLDLYKAQLGAADSDYLRQRVADIAEIQRCLCNHLGCAAPTLRCKDMARCDMGHCQLGNDHILVAQELTPCMAIEVDTHTVGFLVEKGGRNSHAAILARALQLPAVSGIPNISASIPLEDQVLLNGDTGQVVLNPSEQTLAHYRRAVAGCARLLPVVSPTPELKVMANIELAAGVDEALSAEAEGIGMYRTEMEVLAEGRLLSEAEQEARYIQVLEAMGERPVYIRLLDLGADKAAAWMRIPKEDNPTLGCRGARLLLARPELLREQARALVRASVHRPIHVVYPMIVDVEQFLKVRALFEESVADLMPANLRHGVLFEVPSACLQVRRILQKADFGCIGTNDLMQYLFAADRTNEAVASDTRLDHPALWLLIEDLAKAAREAGKPMTICGELAGNPDLTHRIIQAGIGAVSIRPKRIAEVRQAARCGDRCCGRWVPPSGRSTVTFR